jgi:hypothetical protein
MTEHDLERRCEPSASQDPLTPDVLVAPGGHTLRRPLGGAVRPPARVTHPAPSSSPGPRSMAISRIKSERAADDSAGPPAACSTAHDPPGPAEMATQWSHHHPIACSKRWTLYARGRAGHPGSRGGRCLGIRSSLSTSGRHRPVTGGLGGQRLTWMPSGLSASVWLSRDHRGPQKCEIAA